jgi:LysM repeat protein
LEATTAGRIQVLPLQNDDLVLVMTRVVAAGLDRAKLPDEVMGLGSSEPKLICDALMKPSAASREDRTVVVICGPYQPEVEPGLEDLRQAIAALEAKVDNLVENDGRREVAALVSQREASNTVRQGQNLTQQIQELKDDLAGKAAQIDLLELDEKLLDFSTALQSKADTVAVLGLQRDVLKLRLVANATGSSAIETDDPNGKAEAEPAPEPVKTEVLAEDIEEDHEEDEAGVSPPAVNIPEIETLPAGSARYDRSRLARAVLVVLLTAIAGVVVGGWLQSRLLGNKQETWSVKTTANQILISRLDGSGQQEQGTVSLNVAEPLKATGEQTFSSFADVKRYVDTLTSPAPPTPPGQTSLASQANDRQGVEGVTEVTVKPGDTLQKLTQRYDVAPEKLKELNPGITRWPAIRSGQRILVPAATPASPTPSPAGAQATVQPASNNSVATIEVTVGPGDSLNRFVLRYKSTPERLRELNPQITNWGSIRTGQRLLVPAPPGG